MQRELIHDLAHAQRGREHQRGDEEDARLVVTAPLHEPLDGHAVAVVGDGVPGRTQGREHEPLAEGAVVLEDGNGELRVRAVVGQHLRKHLADDLLRDAAGYVDLGERDGAVLPVVADALERRRDDGLGDGERVGACGRGEQGLARTNAVHREEGALEGARPVVRSHGPPRFGMWLSGGARFAAGEARSRRRSIWRFRVRRREPGPRAYLRRRAALAPGRPL